jgi:hypothetical protein
MTDLFESNSAADDVVAYPDKSKDWLTELVGEGKKFADEKALAYAKAQSDAFIEQLQKENARLRGELTGSKTLEDVMTAIEKKKAQLPDADTKPVEGTDGNKLTPEVLDEVLNKKLSAAVSGLKREQQAETNVNKVVAELKRIWGDEYPAKLEAETKKLDLGKDFVTQLARERPEALLVLLGVRNEQPRSSPSPAGTVNTQGLPREKFNGEKTLSYYQKLKKENRSKYETPAIQNEMHAQALKLREAFFDV